MLVISAALALWPDIAAHAIVIESLIRVLFETFGPFLIPATLFVLGVIGYLLLYALGRFRKEDWSGDV